MEPVEKEQERHLHIFVNRRKFERSDGVKEEMLGSEITGLVGVPSDSAVLRRETGDREEIEITALIAVKNGDRFLVTRKTVEGGNEPRAH